MPSMLHFDSDEQTILGNASNSSGIIQFLPSSVMNDYNETVIYLYIKGKSLSKSWVQLDPFWAKAFQNPPRTHIIIPHPHHIASP